MYAAQKFFYIGKPKLLPFLTLTSLHYDKKYVVHLKTHTHIPFTHNRSLAGIFCTVLQREKALL